MIRDKYLYRATSRRIQQWHPLFLIFVLGILWEMTNPDVILYAQSATPSFSLQTYLPLNDDTLAVGSGDFNGDGTLDLVVGNRGQNMIYLNDARGNVVKTIPFGGTEETVDLAIADLNGDSKLDLVTYNLGAPTVIYINNGADNFAPQQTLAAASAAGDQLAIGDLDGDGDYDLIAARAQSGSTIYRNNGQAAFTEGGPLPAGFSPYLIDYDRDGDLDLFLLQRDSTQPTRSSLYRFRNNGSGTFVSTKLNLPGGKPFNQRFAAADLDGNGDLDFVMSSTVAAGCSGSGCEDLRLLLDRGLLGFTSIPLDSAAASNLTLADLDNDGDLDIATTGLVADTQRPDDGQSRFYLNNGTGGLLQPASFVALNVGSAQIGARDLAVADLDNDGLLDILFGTAGANAIYRSQPAQFFDRCTSNLLLLDPRLMADLNRDGYQDLILQSGLLLLNDRTGNFQPSISLPLLLDLDSHLTTADLNGDGRLDLIAAHQSRAATVYTQSSNGQFVLTATLDERSYPVTAVATGDINNDGQLDLVLGRGSSAAAATANPGQNLLYLNDGAAHFSAGQPFSTVVDDTQDIALGDLDADGDLDIVVANAIEATGQQQGQQNYLYMNDGSGHFTESHALGSGTDRTLSIAIGDLNGDGQLDIVLGNRGQLNAIHYNDGSGGFAQAQLLGQLPDETSKILLVDLDHDRDLDLIAANQRQSDALYTNNGDGQLTAVPAFAEPNPSARVFTIAVGDLDRDGDLDLVADLQPLSVLPTLTDCIFSGQRVAPLTAPNRLPQIVVAQRGRTVGAGPYASPQTFAQAAIPFSFTLFDPEAKPVDIHAFYSLNGGGQWFPAVPTATTVTKNLTTRDGAGAAAHTFTWDVYGSNFLGHSDLVVLRIEAIPSPLPLRNGRPGPFARPYAAAETYPLRVRGTQVRVINSAGAPVAGALLYKVPAGSTARADTFPLRNGVPVRTNPLGFIESRGQLTPGDQLIALQPISTTHAFTLYYSSATPTVTGLDAFIVQAAGVQTLTVSAANPLTLFHLRVALEWDARNDGTFLADLQNAIENASEVLFDVSDGQVALGDVTIAQAKDGWSNANVLIYASNSINPRATMGGVVITPTAESGINGLIPNAYWPGQIHMGPYWDPFGENEAELRQDWWLAFAHELSHYLLFLPDNYLGLEQGVLHKIDCQGSFMTNTYEETYREFLTRDRWNSQPDCLYKSIAANTTGRADWETVQHFLPWLRIPATAAAVNPGPQRLPLQVTRVHIQAPRTPSAAPVLAARNFDLRDASGGEITRLRQAEGYLIKTGGTPQLEDDQLISLGSTGAGSDRIKVRGAEAGDRLCVFQGTGELAQVGCETVTADSTSVRLHPVSGWAPQITVTPINSTTLEIHVMQPLNPGEELRLQLLPSDRESSDGVPSTAPWTLLQPENSATPHLFQQTISLDVPIFEGFARVWIANSEPVREAITHFYLSPGWGPNMRPPAYADRHVWGPNMRPPAYANRRAWGANSRSMAAPIASGDGKVTIFDVADILGDSGASALQALATLPNLPLWVTPIGAGYRFVGTKSFAGTIAFHYLEREVPRGYEHTLAVYYWRNAESNGEAPQWQRLATDLDMDENMAAARMPQDSFQGQGIFALMATVEMPALTPTWNLFAYPIPGERSVATALASIEGAYTSVYFNGGSSGGTADSPWRLYDATVATEYPDFAPWINDLSTLQFGHTYWLYATQAITPYLQIGTANGIDAAAAATNSLLPPATYFGPITGDDMLTLSDGMVLIATVNGQACGQGTLLQLAGSWVYKIQVAAAVQGNYCGVPGDSITFLLNDRRFVEQPAWDNQQAHYRALAVAAASAQTIPEDIWQKEQGSEDDINPGTGDGLVEYQLFLPLLRR